MDENPVASIHAPVMTREVLAALQPRPNGRYLDATLGLGGHAEAVLRNCPDCQIAGLDRDEEALTLAKERLRAFGGRVHYFHLPFSRFPEALRELGWQRIDGALADLGVSSLQLDKGERGFSFRENGPLDMRMDQSAECENAWQLVNRASVDELREILLTLGEDPLAPRIVAAIEKARRVHSIDSSSDLARIVCQAYPAAVRSRSRRNPATRTFQALRMKVNNELGELEAFLNEILPWLGKSARLVIISFHSLEDRIIKNTFKKWAGKDHNPWFCQNDVKKGSEPEVKIIYKKPLIADKEELAQNLRASSAKLRAVEKLA